MQANVHETTSTNFLLSVSYKRLLYSYSLDSAAGPLAGPPTTIAADPPPAAAPVPDVDAISFVALKLELLFWLLLLLLLVLLLLLFNAIRCICLITVAT